MALTTTYGSASADSYVTVAEAAAIVVILRQMTFYGINFTGWDAKVSDTAFIEETLRMAAVRIDGLSFLGDPVSPDQARAWPRDGLDRSTGEYAPTAATPPKLVQWAQVAEAATLLVSAPTASTNASRGVISERIGNHAVTFSESQQASMAGQKVSSAAETLLRTANLLRGRVSSIYTPRS